MTKQNREALVWFILMGSVFAFPVSIWITCQVRASTPNQDLMYESDTLLIGLAIGLITMITLIVLGLRVKASRSKDDPPPQ